MNDYIIFGALLFFAISLLSKCVKIASEAQRFAIFTFNTFRGLKGPGIFFSYPVATRWIKIAIGDKGTLSDTDMGRFQNAGIPVDSEWRLKIGANIEIERFEGNTVFVRKADY